MARMGDKRNACRFSIGKHEENRLLGRPGCRWEANMKRYHKNRMEGRGVI